MIFLFWTSSRDEPGLWHKFIVSVNLLFLSCYVIISSFYYLIHNYNTTQDKTLVGYRISMHIHSCYLLIFCFKAVTTHFSVDTKWVVVLFRCLRGVFTISVTTDALHPFSASPERKQGRSGVTPTCSLLSVKTIFTWETERKQEAQVTALHRSDSQSLTQGFTESTKLTHFIKGKRFYLVKLPYRENTVKYLEIKNVNLLFNDLCK